MHPLDPQNPMYQLPGTWRARQNRGKYQAPNPDGPINKGSMFNIVPMPRMASKPMGVSSLQTVLYVDMEYVCEAHQNLVRDQQPPLKLVPVPMLPTTEFCDARACEVKDRPRPLTPSMPRDVNMDHFRNAAIVGQQEPQVFSCFPLQRSKTSFSIEPRVYPRFSDEPEPHGFNSHRVGQKNWSVELNRPRAVPPRIGPPTYADRSSLDASLSLVGMPRWMNNGQWRDPSEPQMRFQLVNYSAPVYQKGDGYGSGEPRIRHGRSGGAWRHIRSCVESGGSFITWVDGGVKTTDTNRCPPFGDCSTISAYQSYSAPKRKPITSAVAMKNASNWIGPYEVGRGPSY